MSLVGAKDVDAAAPAAAALGAVPAVCQTTTVAAAATCRFSALSYFSLRAGAMTTYAH